MLGNILPGAGYVKRILAFGLCVISQFAAALSTDLSTAPLVTSSATAVKPNLMFVLDDSGSMAWEYMPDVVGAWGTGRYGYWSPQCNGLAYNPNVTYTVPVTYAGVSFANSSYPSAWTNGFNTAAGTVNISGRFYYQYSGAQTTAAQKNYYDSNSTFYRECSSSVGNAPGSGVFPRVLVSSLTAAQQANYANWYSYYRTRILAMKTAAGLAFSGIDNRYRIGFMTINNNGGSDLLNIDDFDATQKQNWYAKLYASSASGSTPTRSALSVAGLIYANKLSSYNSVAVTDPMQYSCQQNFTIMASDGFWNSGSCNNGSSGCYNGGAGMKLDAATSVGNQDYVGVRPYFDGSAISTTVTTTYKTYVTTQSIVVPNTCTTPASRRRILSSTVTTTRVVITVNGVVSSDTSTDNAANPTQSVSNCTTNVPVNTSGTTTGYPRVVTSTTGTNIANTMADIAYYYYMTDLRSSANGNNTGTLGVDVATDNVPGSGRDTASWQHMTTFTLGLGAYGRMIYSPTYEADTVGDYFNVKAGTVNSSSSSTPCSWAGAGATCNWPVPGSDQEENIDDLWHAAVNGRGAYYSATDPTALASGLSGALAGVASRLGSSAAATTSNPNVSSGDNYVFSTTFVSQKWYGELVRQTMNLTTGAIAPISSYPCPASVCDWSAQGLLDAKVSSTADTRTIYLFDSSASNLLKPFVWSGLSVAEQGNFGVTKVSTLSQYSSLSTANQTAAVGASLVNYLRGQRGNEGTLYRSRDHILGDIVSSEAVYVKTPQFNYSDAGYAAFKTANATRTAMVYVGANDGMLHAFDASTGDEVWAYIPTPVLPNLYRLADTNYANNHRFFVDGTPVIGDICVSGCGTSSAVWKTILVGGLNGGGRGFYALDVTNPASPQGLWEFTLTSDSDVGYSFGNPVITKKADGTWVVLVTSGYNNVSPGSGGGYLFVLNAASGAIEGGSSVGKIGTGVGSTSTVAGMCTTAPCPSGLARINGWADYSDTNNTSLRVYGGDLFGNLWRFDINNTLGVAGYDAQHLATLTTPSGVRQPISQRPELGLIGNSHSVVLVGTGRFLGTTDMVDTSAQSFYAIKDPLDTTDWGTVRSSPNMSHLMVTTTTNASGTPVRNITGSSVNWATDIGWFLDLPSLGERSYTDPTLVLGTIVFTSNIPETTACSIGGQSWLYYLDYSSGLLVSGSSEAASWLGNELSTRAEVARLPNGTVIAITRGSGGSTVTSEVKVGGGAGMVRRVNWRELISQ